MKLLLGSLSLSAVILGCLACSCLPQEVEEQFCSAAFVVKVEVLSELQDNIPNNFDAYYEVDVIHVYEPNGANLRKEDRIYTATEGSLCGIPNISPGVYYMTGTYYSGVMRLQLCVSMIEEVNANDKKKDATGLAALSNFIRQTC